MDASRRRVLRLLAAAAAAPLASRLASAAPEASMPAPSSGRMPVVFLAHGAPPLLDDAGWVAELAGWARSLPAPRAILMVSAHWERRPLTLGATRTVPLIHDFYGFPEKYYRVTYPAPGAPELAARVRGLLQAAGVPFESDETRGLDHGAYVPLVCMWPEANVPVLQVSMPTLQPAPLFALGRALAPLRDEGVLVIGSGFLTHNLRALAGPTPSWASEFDAWCADVLSRGDVDALLAYRERAPGVGPSLPTHEHFAPVVLAVGAAAESTGAASFPITGFWHGGSLTRRSVQLG